MPTKTKIKTKTIIIHKATEFFAEKGYHATSLTEVADEVGIKGPAIYKHFSNKEDIYKHVLDTLFQPVSDILGSLTPSTSPDIARDKILRVITLYLKDPNLAKIILHANLSGGFPLDCLIEKSQFYINNYIAQLVDDQNHGWATPYTIITAHSLLLGYISLSPIHQQLFDNSPLEGEMLLSQLQTFQNLLHSTTSTQAYTWPPSRQNPENGEQRPISA